jgi:hypothetical protein
MNDHKKINQILDNLNITSEYKTLNLNLNKKIIIPKNDQFILKIAMGKYAIKLAQNENSGYINKEITDLINLPNYSKLHEDNDFFISKIEFLGKKKGSYFHADKFYNFNNCYTQDNFIKTHLYFKYLLNKYKTSLTSENIKFLNNEFFNFKNFHGNLELPLKISHGDFVHWNTLIFKGKFYSFDLERFEKNRIIYFDLLSWYLIPIYIRIYKMKKLNLNVLFKSILFKLFIIFTKKKLVHSKKIFLHILFFFFIEKKMQFDEINNLFNKIKVVDSDYFNKNKLYSEITNFALNNLVKLKI